MTTVSQDCLPSTHWFLGPVPYTSSVAYSHFCMTQSVMSDSTHSLWVICPDILWQKCPALSTSLAERVLQLLLHPSLQPTRLSHLLQDQEDLSLISSIMRNLGTVVNTFNPSARKITAGFLEFIGQSASLIRWCPGSVRDLISDYKVECNWGRHLRFISSLHTHTKSHTRTATWAHTCTHTHTYKQKKI